MFRKKTGNILDTVKVKSAHTIALCWNYSKIPI